VYVTGSGKWTVRRRSGRFAGSHVGGDLRSRLAGGEVDLAEARDVLGQLEAALGRSDLFPRLEEAVAALEDD